MKTSSKTATIMTRIYLPMFFLTIINFLLRESLSQVVTMEKITPYIKDARLEPGNIFKTIENFNSMAAQCLVECALRAQCKSAAYNQKDHICEMGGELTSQQTSSSWELITADSIAEMRSSSYLGLCNNHDCLEGEVCFRDEPNNSYKCLCETGADCPGRTLQCADLGCELPNSVCISPPLGDPYCVSVTTPPAPIRCEDLGCVLPSVCITPPDGDPFCQDVQTTQQPTKG
ncbi:unnamed protein product [Owenia fusiformis]|uniref:Uncharacterized protein n=1 Tax=Owenia fusiformis TaxID=6347 RepID=A0A8J1Y1X6_OWEFU|nr:unnamed protein product [Owenia fusiformis]